MDNQPQPIPDGLTPEEYQQLETTILAHHVFESMPNTCSSIMAQHIEAPAAAVWPIVRSFDNPQNYKDFIRFCRLIGDGSVGSIREVTVVTGIPASTSTERREILDGDNCIISFSNYLSVTSVNELQRGGGVYSVVLESYIVDIPPGHTGEETKMFTDMVVRLNLQKLAVVAMEKLHGKDE